MLGTIILVLLIFVLYKFFKTTKIKWGTFFHKGLHIEKGRWGCACYSGKQGSTKTSSVIDFIFENVSDDYPLYSNVKSIKGIKYTYFSGLQGFYDILNNGANNCIIFYDEIFTLFDRNSKIPKDFLSFLSQMRKRKIYFITTAQEWLEIPMTLRRYCRFNIQCSLLNIPFFPSLSFKQINDAERMKWDNEQNEYIAPLICNTISKLNLSTLNKYDTNETITHDYIPPQLIYNE